MTKPLVSDELWEKVQPLLPVPKPRRFRFPGRKRIDDRKALTGILFVLKSGIPWEQLPQEMGCGSGMTCWRRLKAWHDAGVWERLHHLLLSKLRAADGLAGSRACVDSASLRARHISPVIALRGTEHGSGLGVYRWVVERTLAWLRQFRRLRVRDERRADIHKAFLSIGCSLICFRRLISLC